MSKAKIKAADAAAIKKAVESSEPIRVADYLLNLPISALTPREKSELWNACGMFVGKCAGRGPLTPPKEVPSAKAKSAK